MNNLATALRLSVLLGFGAILSPTAAQNVLIVDAAGGPGSQFTDLPTAVEAAAPGDTLDVRAGTYRATLITKGIHIVGRPGVILAAVNLFDPSFHVRDIPANQRFSMRNVSTTGILNLVRRCDGPLSFENVRGPLEIEACSQVHLRGQPQRIVVIDSAVTMEGSLITRSLSPFSAIDATRSQVRISRSTLFGGVSLTDPPKAAIESVDSDFYISDVLGGGEIASGVGPTGAAPTPGIRGTGTVVIDPRVVVTSFGGAPTIAGMTTRVATIPTVRASNAVVSGTVQITMEGSPGEGWLLALGEPAAPRVLPEVLGSLWLRDPQLASVGVFPAMGAVGSSLTIPNDPSLAGVQIVYQAVATQFNEELRTSNPALFTVRP